MLISERDEMETARLVLIAIEPSMLQSELIKDGQLGPLIGCAVPENWPPVDWEPHVLQMVLSESDRHPELAGWHRYVALRQANGTRLLIGCVGAFLWEVRPTECEVGYSILAPHEGKGYATEAVRALLLWLRARRQLTGVVAHTYPRLAGSIRVMEKCGFVPDGDGEEPGTVRYRLRWSEEGSSATADQSVGS